MNKKLIYGLIAIAAVITVATFIIIYMNPPPTEIIDGDAPST